MMPELLTGEEGIEPPSGVLETLILPMNYTPISINKIIVTSFYFFCNSF